MQTKKLTAIFCAITIMFTMLSVPALAEGPEVISSVTQVGTKYEVKPTTYTDMLWDDFEDGDLSDWYFRNDVNASGRKAEILEENGNRFLRFTLNGAYSNTYDMIDRKLPFLSRSFVKDGAVKIDMNSISIFEMDVRTSAVDTDVSKALLLNVPYRGSKIPGTDVSYTYNNADLGGQGRGSRNLFTINKGTNVANFGFKSNWQTQISEPYNYTPPTSISQISPNKWYKVRYVYDNKSNPRTLSVYLYPYNPDGTLDTEGVTKVENNVITAWWYTHYDWGEYKNGTVTQPQYPITTHEIYDLSLWFGLNYKTYALTGDMDIDNLKFFAQKTVVDSTVSSNTDIGILYKPTEVSVTFDAPVDYTDGSITVLNSSGTPVEHTGSFDNKTFTYTAYFNGAELSGDTYRFVLGNGVQPSNFTEGKVFGIDFKSREIPFICYASMPPSAENVTIEGRVIPGTFIEASYDFVTETGTEGDSVHKWYKADSEEGPFTLIDGADTKALDVTTFDVYGKYIKYAVQPVSDAGLLGLEYESNVIIPEIKPTVANLRISTETPFPGSHISALYDFGDENGDYELGSVIKWYTSPDGTGDWTLAYTGDRYVITEEDKGLYIKCAVIPKSDSECENTGAEYESAVIGPVINLIESTNILVDPSFENTAIGENWYYSAKDSWQGVYITKNGARTGEYSLRQPPRVHVEDTWGQSVLTQADTVYLMGGYVKKSNDKTADVGDLRPYTFNSGVSRYDKSSDPDYYYSSTKNWSLCAATFLTDSVEKKRSFCFVSFENINSLDILVDDMYVGELLIADIENYEVEDITIPLGDDVVRMITNKKILNQLGTTHGLRDQTVNISMSETEGVYINENGELVVTNRANTGKLQIRLYCEPTYPGANQEIYEEYITVNLLPNNDKTPKAYDVTATGIVAEGNTLTGSYKFYQVDGEMNASVLQWMYCDTKDGQYVPIPNANGLTYTVESDYADKFIKFVVSPKTESGMTGADVYSDFLTSPKAPVANNITISGDFNIGGTITVDYDFYDENGDAVSTTLYRWQIADSNGIFDDVSGQIGKNLVLTGDMVDKTIRVGVTPVSENAPARGTEVFSNSVFGPCAPEVYNVWVTNEGGRLVGNYTYNHVHGTKEKGTTYKWTVDGAVVSDKISYTPNFSGRKTVMFTVTPKSEGNPSIGKSVSCSLVFGNVDSGITGGFVGGGGGGSSFGGGGGGTSSGSGAGVTNINDMNLADPTKESEKEPEASETDIANHWGKAYIEEMAGRGVMTADENGNFNPDVNVTREEMVTFLFDALGLEASDYSNQFGDVEDGEFAKKLQTMLDNGTIAKDTDFRPDDTISREEMCKILYISLQNAGKLAEVEKDLISSFADYNGISEWARVYVNAIYGNKIMVGVSDSEFDAQGTVTKAQAATMLVRILNLTEGE